MRSWSRLVPVIVCAISIGAAALAACERIATQLAALATAIGVVSGNGQTRPVNQPLPQPLVVSVADSQGNPVGGAQVRWLRTAGSGTLSSGATTTGSTGLTQVGYTLGSTPGTDSIRAVLAGTSASVMFNETATAPPPGSTWPNEPAGFTVLTDEPFNALVENGWNQTFNSSMSIVTDTSGPISPPNVIQWFYPTGFVAGSAPGTEYYSFGVSGIREHYTGFWWKVSNPWQGHSSGVNKVLFSTLITQSNLFFFMLQGQSPPYHTQINTDYASPRNLPANVNNVGVTLGVWHQVEIYQKHSTTPTSADGIVRWWLDNTLVGNYTDVNFPNEDSQGDKFSPTWGGVGGSKTEGDYYWVDHVHISRP